MAQHFGNHQRYPTHDLLFLELQIDRFSRKVSEARKVGRHLRAVGRVLLAKLVLAVQARLLKERTDNDKDRPQGGIENVSGRVRRPRPEQPQETGGGLLQHTVGKETRACEWP